MAGLFPSAHLAPVVIVALRNVPLRRPTAALDLRTKSKVAPREEGSLLIVSALLPATATSPKGASPRAREESKGLADSNCHACVARTDLGA